MAPPRRLPFLLRRLVYNVGLRRRIARVEPDLVVGVDVDGFLLPPDGRVPKVVALKGVAADEARFERGTARLLLRTLAVLERRNARRADRVVVPSRYSAGAATRAYGLDPARIAVVPESVDPAPWNRLRADPPRRSDPRPTVLSVARQYPRKNTRTLLKAFSKVVSVLPDARLRIVGGGPELPALHRERRALGLEERVELAGALPDVADVRREYFRADCFCLPTLQESFGIAFLEAMSAGLPVVACRAGSVPEVVSDGVTGLLVDPEDPEALVRALLRVLGEPGLARRLGRAGVERARRYTPEAMARAFLAAVAPLKPPDQQVAERPGPSAPD